MLLLEHLDSDTARLGIGGIIRDFVEGCCRDAPQMQLGSGLLLVRGKHSLRLYVLDHLIEAILVVPAPTEQVVLRLQQLSDGSSALVQETAVRRMQLLHAGRC